LQFFQFPLYIYALVWRSL